MTEKPNILIASPLEEIYVEKIKISSKGKFNVIFDPEFLPPTRYIADHNGIENFIHTQTQEKKWNNYLEKSEILWDFPFNLGKKNSKIQKPKKVKWIQTTSSGIGQKVKKINFLNPKIIITTARGIHAKPLTEFVFFSILNFYKNKEFLDLSKKEKSWKRYCGIGIEGKSIGIIGAGGIGRQIIKLAKAFDMKTMVLKSPYSSVKNTTFVDEVFEFNHLHEMVKKTDVLVLCAPHTSQTENLINKQAFEVCKDGMILINISRGSLIDEEELISALKTKKIAFAALDVFKVEPLPKESLLWALDNVMISPHSASTVENENELITDIFCHNLNHYINGNFVKMKNIFDFNKMY